MPITVAITARLFIQRCAGTEPVADGSLLLTAAVTFAQRIRSTGAAVHSGELQRRDVTEFVEKRVALASDGANLSYLARSGRIYDPSPSINGET